MNNQQYVSQVPANHYRFEKYFFSARWMSYFYQIREIVNRKDIHSVLDIGPGTPFLRNSLVTFREDITYKTLDIAEDTHPDIIGGVTNIPIADNSYDVVCAFQVLEHIEYRDMEKALREMKRVSKKYVFISLPHFGPSVELSFKLPFIKRVKLAWKIPYMPVHTFNGQHYWEIGKKGYSVQKIRKIMKKHFHIIDEYVPFENQYHRFYILRKIHTS